MVKYIKESISIEIRKNLYQVEPKDIEKVHHIRKTVKTIPPKF